MTPGSALSIAALREKQASQTGRPERAQAQGPGRVVRAGRCGECVLPGGWEMAPGKQAVAKPWRPWPRARSVHSGEVFVKTVWVLGTDGSSPGLLRAGPTDKSAEPRPGEPSVFPGCRPVSFLRAKHPSPLSPRRPHPRSRPPGGHFLRMSIPPTSQLGASPIRCPVRSTACD